MMTALQAAALYEAQHAMQWNGRPLAIHNPQGKPLGDLPVIYGFNNGGSAGLLHAQLIAEDGTALGSHCCSSEGYMPHDLGCLDGARADRHETFRQHYPDGYRMEFVSHGDVDAHAGLKVAFERNAARAQANEASQ